MNIQLITKTLAVTALAGVATLAHAALPAYRTLALQPLDPAIPGWGAPGFFGLTEAGQTLGYASVEREYQYRPTIWDASGKPQALAPDVGRRQVIITGANETGTFVGWTWETSPSGEHTRPGLVWQDGALIRSKHQTGADFIAGMVNDQGWQGGSVATADGTQAALWDGKSLRVLPDLGPFSEVTAIHHSGFAVGTSHMEGDPTGLTEHALVWRDGKMTDLSHEGDLKNWVVGMDDAGTLLVGHHDERYVMSYDLWDGHSFTPVALAKSEGEVVRLRGMTGDGTYWGVLHRAENSFREEAAIWQDGAAYKLDDYLDPVLKAQGWQLGQVVDINDAGQVLVTGSRSEKVGEAWMTYNNAFVLTPVPEPGTAMLSLVGLGFMGWRLGKSRRPSAH